MGHPRKGGIPFECEYCGKPGVAKQRNRRFCNNKGKCQHANARLRIAEAKFEAARKKESGEQRR